MVGVYLKSAVAGAFLLGMATAAMAVTGEFGNRCTMGLALGKDVQTDCSVNAQLQGKTNCTPTSHCCGTAAMMRFVVSDRQIIRAPISIGSRMPYWIVGLSPEVT